jgi:hypothetical protein
VEGHEQRGAGCVHVSVFWVAYGCVRAGMWWREACWVFAACRSTEPSPWSNYEVMTPCQLPMLLPWFCLLKIPAHHNRPAVVTQPCCCACRYASGARYEGEWRDNVKAGRGVYYFPKVGAMLMQTSSTGYLYDHHEWVSACVCDHLDQFHLHS